MAGQTAIASATTLAIKVESRPLLPQLAVAPRPIESGKSAKSLAPSASQSLTPGRSISSKPQPKLPESKELSVKSKFPLEDGPMSQLSTSKVWVLPPRPKPGRKPATDTPPTKRKAQNRAAQRAFRERRAARVSELEEMLTEVNAERDLREKKLSDTLKAMSQENYELRKSVDELRNEIKSIYTSRQSSAVGTPRMEQSSYSFQAQPGSAPASGGNGGYPFMTQMVSPAPSTESPMDVLDRVLELRLPVATDTSSSKDESDDDCGVCTKDDCICETIGIKGSKSQVSTPKFHIPEYTSDAVPLKRQRASGNKTHGFKKLNPRKESMEIDFTEVFAKVSQESNAPPRKRSRTSYSSDAGPLGCPSDPVDRCGFCADGTPCLCAETAKQEAANMEDIRTNKPLSSVTASSGSPSSFSSFSRRISQSNSDLSPNTSHRNSMSFTRLPSLASGDYQMLSSPISIVPVDQHYMGPSSVSSQSSGRSSGKSSTSGCTGNPGTCSQCQADPMSTLFCTTLASRVYASTTVKSSRHSVTGLEDREKGGCCGGAGKAGGCCKEKKTAGPEKKMPEPPVRKGSIIDLPPGTPSTTTPSGTFIPCSAAYQTLSRHKDFSRSDIGKIVGKLNTRGMQVEVSSVANVLRELDRRLYQ